MGYHYGKIKDIKPNKVITAEARTLLQGRWRNAIWATSGILFGLLMIEIIASIIYSAGAAFEVMKGGDFSSPGLLAGAIVLALITGTCSFLWDVYGMGGMIHWILNFMDRKETSVIQSLKAALRIYGKLFLAGLLITLIVLLKTCLLIVPGILAALDYSLTIPCLLDDPELGIREALRRSRAIIHGHRWQFWKLCLRMCGWGILCIFTLGIGLFWLWPYSITAYMVFYRACLPTPDEEEAYAKLPPVIRQSSIKPIHSLIIVVLALLLAIVGQFKEASETVDKIILKNNQTVCE